MAQFLRDQGYRAFALRGGYMAWRDLGYPLESKEAELNTTIADVCPECGAPAAAHGSRE